MVEHLRIIGGIIRDLKAVGKEIFEGEQVLNVIRAPTNKLKHWNHVKMALTNA